MPLDTQTILGSVLKTIRLFTVEENPRLLGCGGVFSLEPAEKDLRLIGDLAPAVDPLRAQGSSPAAAASAKPVEPKSGGGT